MSAAPALKYLGGQGKVKILWDFSRRDFPGA